MSPMPPVDIRTIANEAAEASDGALLEIGVLDIDGDDPVVIHAMALRQKFYRFLG